MRRHQPVGSDAVGHSYGGETSAELARVGKGEPEQWGVGVPAFICPGANRLQAQGPLYQGRKPHGLALAGRKPLADLGEIPARYGGERFGQSVVEAEVDEGFFSWRWRLPMGTECSCPDGNVFVSGEQEAAFAGPEDLAVFETKTANIADRAEQPPMIPSAVRLACVLDHCQAVFLGEGEKPVRVAAGAPPKVHGKDRAGPARHFGGHVVVVQFEAI